MRKFLYIIVSDEQVEYTQKLVDYSIENHTVSDIFDKENQRAYRHTGTLGEVVVADLYGFNRPTKSFGAIDGQDNGRDFTLNVNGVTYSLDVKTMKRRSNRFTKQWVLNISSRQLNKATSLTDFYFGVSIHFDLNIMKYVATIIGCISKSVVENGKVGKLYKAGTKRIKDNGDYFIFKEDTYEIYLKDFIKPIPTEKLKSNKNLKVKKIENFNED